MSIKEKPARLVLSLMRSRLPIIRKIGFWLPFFASVFIWGGNFWPGLSLLAVQSGSMEPAILKGSLIVIKKQKEYQKGEIITYQNKRNPQITTTHRLIEANGQLKTKGDANDSSDSPITPEQVLGKVILTLPFLGYFVLFSKTLPGLIIFIIVPTALIIGTEILVIKKRWSKD